MKSSEHRTEWATYRTDDPIGSLEIKITYHKENLSSQSNQSVQPDVNDPAPQPNTEAQNENVPETTLADGETPATQPENDQNQQQEQPSADDQPNVFTVKWGVREYSLQEVQKCLDNVPISDDVGTAAKHENAIKRKIEEDPTFKGSEIFTYVGDDNYIDPSEIDIPYHGAIGQRKPTDLANAILSGSGSEAMVRVVRSPAVSMHVFISTRGPDGVFYQDLLGIIRVYPNGRIEVRPPFSNKCQVPTMYKFFTKTNEQVYYQFDVVESQTDQANTYALNLKADLSRRRAIFDAPQSECSLGKPPDNNMVRMFYFGEICYAKITDASSVIVQWSIKMPKDWIVDERQPEQLTNGVSQLAKCNDDGIAHINLPIDLVATCSSQVAPILCLQLHTVTSSKSHQVIGYGEAPLPMTRGTSELTIKTVRVRGTIRDDLRLQFLDSGLEIQRQVESETIDPDMELATAQNRFGLKVAGSGAVVARFILAMQSSLYQKRGLQQNTTIHTMSTLGPLGTRHSSVLSKQ